eukprot:TRINITY_DN3355_c0_g2_i2.p1 TRINITY_DN3355_c0_g2~~TRINITY_DN3355_c0_g2_i2.p1  ORF type:complete len:380 (-),score=57.43 TRINITY_DN3355_c0_g2_i2:63-1202(-)
MVAAAGVEVIVTRQSESKPPTAHVASLDTSCSSTFGSTTAPQTESSPGDGSSASGEVSDEPARFDADEYLPRSTSSAMPDLRAEFVPRLKARVHQALSAAELSRITLDDLTFRPLQEDDFDEMIALHTEWFPVSYSEAFYKRSVRGQLFTLVATISRAQDSSGDSTSFDMSRPAGCRSEEALLGMITMSTCCEHHARDIDSVLAGDCTTLCDAISQDAVDDDGELTKTGCLAYILTLGVVDGFRRKGLAGELLRRMIQHVDRHMVHVQAVYLHVITYNTAAIRLYESLGFKRVAQFANFYSLQGTPYDSYLYALYRHGGRPPWTWRLRQFLGVGTNLSWKEWVFSAWSSLAFWKGNDDRSLASDSPPHKQAPSLEEAIP